MIEITSYTNPRNINDSDEVLFRYHVDGNKVSIDAIWKPNGTVEIVHDGRPDSDGMRSGYSFYKLGNNGTVLGNQGLGHPVIWNKMFGVLQLDIKKDIPEVAFNARLIDINSFGLIIGTYSTATGKIQSFIYRSGSARKILLEDLPLKGYQPLSVEVTAINDNGAILGKFVHGHKHPLKDSWIVDGEHYFLWDGQTSIMELPETGECVAIALNNRNEVLIRQRHYDRSTKTETSATYVWEKKKGLTFITDKIWPEKFNDNGHIIGLSDGCLAVFANCEIHKIQEDINGIVTNFSSNSLVDINNNDCVLGFGDIWKEQHFFVLQPK